MDDGSSDDLPPEFLAAWKTPEPLPGFAERALRRCADGSAAVQPVVASVARPVVASVAQPVAQRRRRGLALAFVAGAVAAAAAAILVLMFAGRLTDVPTSARAADRAVTRVDRRTSFAIGSRATGVAAPGTDLGWRVTNEQVHVHQRGGEVFYRVDPGDERFMVATTHGEIVVEGTCFTVRSGPTYTEVDVHEGEVTLRDHRGSTHHVLAGEQGTLGPAHPTAFARRATTRSSARPSPLPDPASPPSDPPPASCECACEADDDGWPPFPVPPATLEAYARECRVLLDAPPLDAARTVAVDHFIDDLGLIDDEAEAARRALARVHGQLLTTLRTEFTAATGEDAQEVTFDYLISGLRGSTTMSEEAQVRQGIAEDRAAGIELAPRPDASPFESASRAVYGFGDAFERELAEELGTERARELRARRDGWSGERTTDEGCP